MNEQQKKLAGQILLGLTVVGGIYLLYRNNRKNKAAVSNTVMDMPQPPVMPVVNPISQVENTTPIDNFDVVKDVVPPVPDIPIVPVNTVVPPVTTPVKREDVLIGNLMKAINILPGGTNLDKAKRFLDANGVDISTLADSTDQGIVNFAVANGWNPAA